MNWNEEFLTKLECVNLFSLSLIAHATWYTCTITQLFSLCLLVLTTFGVFDFPILKSPSIFNRDIILFNLGDLLGIENIRVTCDSYEYILVFILPNKVLQISYF